MKRKSHIFAVAIIILFFPILVINKSFACSPSGPDAWFSEKLVFDQNTFPEGIKIIETDPTYEPYSLINETNEPFYFIEKKNLQLELDTKTPDGLPSDIRPLLKVIKDHVYFWGTRNSSIPETWLPNSGGINNSAATRVNILSYVKLRDEKSNQIYQDNRPTNVTLPKPQAFIVEGYFKGEPVEIKGTIIYSLNKNYDPTKSQKAAQACDQWQKNLATPSGMFVKLFPFIFISLFIVFVGLVAWIGFKIIRKFNK